jgi:hypothetical protein
VKPVGRSNERRHSGGCDGLLRCGTRQSAAGGLFEGDDGLVAVDQWDHPLQLLLRIARHVAAHAHQDVLQQ